MAREIAEDALYLLLGFASAYIFYYFILSSLLHTPIPVVSIMTGSMIPTLYPGDAVVVYGGTSDIKIGDIIVFDALAQGCTESGNPVTYPIIHRVVKIHKDGTLETMGDNNAPLQLACERNIKRENVYGKVVLKLPLIGWPRKIIYDLFRV